MAQSTLTGRAMVVGDYIFGLQIGSGSFTVVWHTRHGVRETEFTVKEIVTEKLGKKLQNSLLSEIYILMKINQPNIIRLYDMIEVLVEQMNQQKKAPKRRERGVVRE
ncbi:hypothetical protein QJS10_CPB15g01446 [Acorus calamus]|uniref:Protein kinase domain-containing protein n=1 Tax=Acorus calamus TaxID=4465 RepID=A0AAV9D777_ACOCL|nr:hypothetical protein QJS10_CPB15g01446 [Acorus calamus]